LGDYYRIIHPADIIPREKWIWAKGSIVRMAMARGGNGWKNLVPKEVAQYLEQHNLVERFRIEFGLEILVSLGCTDYIKNESPQEEKAHTKEV
ncbi:MAG: hypothetical protein HZC29_06620, partial [Thaumarchaeota archaeon]|nr:hypothetical protein [Nitrososphaerota archaeon]